MSVMFRLVTAAFVAAALTSPVLGVPDTDQSVRNLRAFAKLYGYVRFFHPSDEASEVDWDAFAIHGASRVKDADSRGELRKRLEELFHPIAPSVQLYSRDQTPAPYDLPGDSATCLPVCWQHKGIGLQEPSIYQSWRANRPKTASRASRSVVQYAHIPPGDSTGRRKLRVRARTRTKEVEPDDEPVLLAVGVNPDEKPMAALKRVSSVPMSGEEWQEFEVEAALEPGQVQAAVGVANGLSCELWADDFEAWISAGDSWARLDLKDPGFEDSVSLEASPVWMYVTDAEKSGENPFAGAKCLHVKTGTSPGTFAGSPLPGEYVDKPLDRGLGCRVPLCLWSKDNHTLPRADSAALEQLKADVAAVSLDIATDPPLDVRLGDVVIAWTVLQHFYPYFDVVDVNWDTVLTSAFSEALSDTDALDFLFTLRRMAVALRDGHADVGHPLLRGLAYMPIKVELIEDRVTVVVSMDTNMLRRGDVVLAIDGVPAEEALDEKVSRASGSPQWKLAKGLGRLVRGRRDSTVGLRVWRENDTFDLKAKYSFSGNITLDQGDSIRQLEDGIWFVDLNRAGMPEIDSVMDELAEARGVIFDLRGYPKGNHGVISHLLSCKDTSDAWMQVPQIVYPDREGIWGFAEFGWQMEPKEPRIQGKVVFLTNGSAISYAESFMGLVEGYKLGDIVGQPTAGTNGNVNPFDLPGGYSFWWTGMKVLKHDGSQHHLIGIQPTVPLERTLKAVREGRDEYIEKALELIKL